MACGGERVKINVEVRIVKCSIAAVSGSFSLMNTITEHTPPTSKFLSTVSMCGGKDF